MDSFTVTSWWQLLCAAAAINMVAWALSAAAVKRDRSTLSAEAALACRRQLVLSALYVFGCAFRSADPVFDIPRICLFDSWLSSVLVGRTVATVAELAFAVQWALLFHQCMKSTDRVSARWVAIAVVTLISLAEVCCWYSVLTTSNAGHICEETLWASTVALLVVAMLRARDRWTGSQRSILIGFCIVGGAYVLYMFSHDVPMYWHRWVADVTQGRHYLTFAEGFHAISYQHVVSYRWEDWKSEVAWMSLYFSVAVWISILLVHVSMREAKRIPAAAGAAR